MLALLAAKALDDAGRERHVREGENERRNEERTFHDDLGTPEAAESSRSALGAGEVDEDAELVAVDVLGGELAQVVRRGLQRGDDADALPRPLVV